MQKWETRFETVGISQVEDARRIGTRLGEEGWEIVSATPVGGHPPSQLLLVFKRPKS